jgi:RNA polymerase sigma factor (sigma-70 family)
MAFDQKFSVETEGWLSKYSEMDQSSVNAAELPTPRGHSAALEEIWRAHSKQVLRITQRITNNREDAEDALQDSFLRAYVHLHNFDGRSSIATWLTRIAINSSLMILRKRATAPRLLSIDDRMTPGVEATVPAPVDDVPSAEANYADLEQQELVRQAIATLRPAIRQVLELRTNEDRSIREVAERMGLSIAATKSRIFRARAALRGSLERKASRRPGRAKRLQLSPA